MNIYRYLATCSISFVLLFTEDTGRTASIVEELFTSHPNVVSMGSITESDGPFHVKRIAIIGAGPSGLAAAKFLSAEQSFETIDIFEKQAEVGGVWNYTSHISGSITVPQTRPDAPPDPPIWLDGAAVPLFSNPMYERMNTNIPKRLMQYSDLDFPTESLLFPTREDVKDYLIRYSQDIRHLVSFSQEVEDVRQVRTGWEVVVKSTITEETKRVAYDAIVIANGHYSIPSIPSVQGIAAFNAAHPTIIQHSKTYRSPDSFAGKKVVVVGSGPSGVVRTGNTNFLVYCGLL